MSVLISTKNTLEPTSVPGDLIELASQLNMAVAQGRDFVVVNGMDGGKVAFRVENITVMKEYDDVDSVFG